MPESLRPFSIDRPGERLYGAKGGGGGIEPAFQYQEVVTLNPAWVKDYGPGDGGPSP